jgi:hypothetical protein
MWWEVSPFTQKDIERIDQKELKKWIDELKAEQKRGSVLRSTESYQQEIDYLSTFLKQEVVK